MDPLTTSGVGRDANRPAPGHHHPGNCDGARHSSRRPARQQAQVVVMTILEILLVLVLIAACVIGALLLRPH